MVYCRIQGDSRPTWCIAGGDSRPAWCTAGHRKIAGQHAVLRGIQGNSRPLPCTVGGQRVIADQYGVLQLNIR
jgi:hypothetical protein